MAGDENTDDSQKTEDPTQKKLDESRKKGQIAMSREVNNWLMLLAGTMLIAGFAPTLFSGLLKLLTVYIAAPEQFPDGAGGVSLALGGGTIESLKLLAFPFLIFMLAAFFGPFLQVGPLWAPESIQPKLSKISPIKGFGRLFSMRSLVEFGKGILKLAIVSVVGVVLLYPYFDKFEHLIGLPMLLLLDEIQALVVRLMIGVLIVLVVVAVIDISYQRYDHQKKMKMSRQEIKDEFKQTEGDPHIKAKLRQLRGEKARQRMMQAVPSADVVITNPTHYSIALKYNPDEMEAPKCVAKGIDEVALRIREVAKEHNIILYENKPLARALYDTVEIDETIPTEQFQAVAEVISYVFKKQGKFK